MVSFSEFKKIVLDGYRTQGVFPMARDEQDYGVSLVAPTAYRSLLPIADLHIPRRLRKTLRNCPFQISVNEAFFDVIHHCAATRGPNRTGSWISDPIIDLFVDFHHDGLAHSIEIWGTDDQLVGGVYGLALGTLFCGESMFSHTRDASKIALVHLAARLHRAGFERFDAQFVNPHLNQFGQYTIPQDEFVRDLPLFVMKHADITLADDAFANDPKALLQWYCEQQHQRLHHAPPISHGHDP